MFARTPLLPLAVGPVAGGEIDRVLVLRLWVGFTATLLGLEGLEGGGDGDIGAVGYVFAVAS